MNLESILKIIEIALAVVGAISLFFTFARAIWIFCITNMDWVSNVSIVRLPKNDEIEETPSGECVFAQTYKLSDDEYTFSYLIRPNNCIIKKIYLNELEYDEEMNLIGRKQIKEFNNISPYNPLVINTSVIGLLPHHSITWSGDYGIKLEYLFQSNGRDGNVDLYGISCNIGWWQRIRRILGFK